MRFATCPHRIPCQTSQWVCGIKTKLAHAVRDGELTLSQANNLLAKYGEHPLVGKPVDVGAPRGRQESLL